VAQRAEKVAGRFQRVKLKLGGRDGLDVERVKSVVGVVDVPLQVDVNEAAPPPIHLASGGGGRAVEVEECRCRGPRRRGFAVAVSVQELANEVARFLRIGDAADEVRAALAGPADAQIRKNDVLRANTI
jgi:hypothetical protein